MTAAIFGCGTLRSSERPNGIQKASPISNTTTAQILIDHSRKQILDLWSWAGFVLNPRDRIRSWIPIHFKYSYYIDLYRIYDDLCVKLKLTNIIKSGTLVGRKVNDFSRFRWCCAQLLVSKFHFCIHLTQQHHPHLQLWQGHRKGNSTWPVWKLSSMPRQYDSFNFF